MITAVAGLVDGSVLTAQVSRAKFEQCQRDGLTGKALIVELLGDDIRPPPRFVDFDGITSDGEPLHLRVMFT